MTGDGVRTVPQYERRFFDGAQVRGQRVRKRQPVGGSMAEAISPASPAVLSDLYLSSDGSCEITTYVRESGAGGAPGLTQYAVQRLQRGWRTR